MQVVCQNPSRRPLIQTADSI